MTTSRSRAGRPTSRGIRFGIALGVLTAAALLASASQLRAATTAGICSPITGHKWYASYGGKSGTRYQWSVIGSAWTCGTAKPWVVKLVKQRPHTAPGLIPLHGGPKGYHCKATGLDKHGYAYLGVCFKGTFKYPITGFQWAGS